MSNVRGFWNPNVLTTPPTNVVVDPPSDKVAAQIAKRIKLEAERTKTSIPTAQGVSEPT